MGERAIMAEFLTTTEISANLVRIIKSAQKQLWIISPYLKINSRIKELLHDRDQEKRIEIRVVCRKKDLRPEEEEWLALKTSITVRFRENLHAKCYLNEKEALLTSMNLYEFSQVNNDEMGMLVSLETDRSVFCKILDESGRLWRHSTMSTPKPSTELPSQPKQRAKRRTERTIAETARSGFCIRCKTTVPLNPVQPHCVDCFNTWNRFKDADYEEKYCHACGNDMATTMNKPVCLPCYRKYRYVLEFAEA